MEDHKKYPPLPSNYVTIVQLQERWLKSRQPPPKPVEQQQEKLTDDSIRVSMNPRDHQFDQVIRVSEEPIDHECVEEKVGDLKNQENGVEAVSGSASVRIWKPKRKKYRRRSNRNREAAPEDLEVGDVVVTGNAVAGGEGNADDSKKEKKRKKKKKKKYDRKKEEVKTTAEENVGGATADSPPVNGGEVRGVRVRDGGETKEVRYEYRKKIRNVAVEVEAPVEATADEVVETRRRFEDLSVNRRPRVGWSSGRWSYGDFGRSYGRRDFGVSGKVWVKKGEVANGGTRGDEKLH